MPIDIKAGGKFKGSDQVEEIIDFFFLVDGEKNGVTGKWKVIDIKGAHVVFVPSNNAKISRQRLNSA